jgi:O-antigen/teichoic acid export membrane protein
MTGHSRLLLANSLGSLALNLLLNLLLIPRLGITGAAIATAVSNLTVSSLQIFETRRLEGYAFSPLYYYRVWIALALLAPVLLWSLPLGIAPRLGVLALGLGLLAACAWFLPGSTPHPVRAMLQGKKA